MLLAVNTTNHEIVVAAAEGQLPAWAVAGEGRRAHMARVADLLGTWSEVMVLPEEERTRWRAAGYLHDALRGAAPALLRAKVPPAAAVLPGPILHGPAVAERLRVDGVLDGELLRALAHHTVGHPSLGRLGRALYVADFLDPGRAFEPEWRHGLRDRMPDSLDAVALEIVGERIRHVVERGMETLPDTVRFWNALREPS